MPNQAQTSQPSDFIIDPVRDGIANALWFASVGALALSGNTPDQFRFNTNEGVVRADLLHGIIDFSVQFPTTVVQTPTNLVNDIAFGLKNLSLGDLCKIDVFVDKSADTIVFRTYDEFGTKTETTLAWDTDWNSAQTIFRFGWSESHVSLEVLKAAATAFVPLANHKKSAPLNIPNRPLNPFVSVVGADDFDVDFIGIKRVVHSTIMLI